MRSCVLRILWTLLISVLGIPFAAAQIHAAGAIPTKNAPRSAHDLIMTSLGLNLCVDGSATYPCPTPITSDDQYIPALSLTYGQVVDGVVLYAPGTLTFGTITLYKDPGTGPVSICVLEIGGNRTCPPGATLFNVGNYTLTAALSFPGISGYQGSSAEPVTVSVTKDTSAIALRSSQNPSALGSPVTITATATGGNDAIPSGQIIFTVDGVALDPVYLDGTGKASFTTSTLALGTHNIVASYAGSANFYPAADTPIFKLQIVPPATTTTVTSSLNPSSIGDTVTFTARIGTAAGFVGAPSGSVTFRDGNVAFGTYPVALKGGQYLAQAAISTLAFGSHGITAVYSGDGSTGFSTSPVYIQQVNYPLTQAPPGYRISVTPSPVIVEAGQTASLTVTVTPFSGFSQPVTLSCTSLPNESACTFGDPSIPAGGGSTTLTLSTTAAHDCRLDASTLAGQTTSHRSSGNGLRYAAPMLAGVFLLLVPRRSRGNRWMRPLLILAITFSLLSIIGCGAGYCVDGTPPGGYTFKVNGTTSSKPVTESSTTEPGAVNMTTSVALSVKQ